ncbi:IS200/IS605 family transposase [Candidatus Beckwithbacteria bacterium]|nr:IS200/IS605 family transposase [Candidatus Beckwithbacteria bacterium]
METRKQAHSVYQCEYHIVFTPKYRYKILREGVKEYLNIKLKEVRKYYPEIEYLQVNIQPDHVHILLSFSPKDSISKVVKIIKQNTSKTLRDKFDFIKQRYKLSPAVWSSRYFVSTVGLDEEMTTKYIKYQEKEKEDLGQAKLAL